MNLTDIMERDIRDAEREQRERADRENDAADHSRPGETLLAVAVRLAAGLAMLGAAFAGGMCYQSRRALKADRDFAAWCDRVEREATERARAMSNYELLNATRRECAAPANR